jgi:hypothetical protein
MLISVFALKYRPSRKDKDNGPVQMVFSDDSKYLTISINARKRIKSVKTIFSDHHGRTGKFDPVREQASGTVKYEYFEGAAL